MKKKLVALGLTVSLIQATAIAAPSFNPFDSKPPAPQGAQPAPQAQYPQQGLPPAPPTQASPQQQPRPQQQSPYPQQPTAPTGQKPVYETTSEQDFREIMKNNAIARQLLSIDVRTCAGEAQFARAAMQAKYQNILNTDTISDVLEAVSIRGGQQLPRLIRSAVQAVSTPAVMTNEKDRAAQLNEFVAEAQAECAAGS